MLLVSYGEVLPMCMTRRYTGHELADRCQKRRRIFEAMVQGPLPVHVFLKHVDGFIEHVPEHKLLSTCDAVSRYHERLRDEPLALPPSVAE